MKHTGVGSGGDGLARSGRHQLVPAVTKEVPQELKATTTRNNAMPPSSKKLWSVVVLSREFQPGRLIFRPLQCL